MVQILVHSHFDLVSLPQALEATEPESEPVTQIAVQYSKRDKSKSYILFHVTITTNKL